MRMILSFSIRCTLVYIIFCLRISNSKCFDLPPVVESAALLAMPFLPAVPFFPVVALDYIPRNTPATYLRNMKAYNDNEDSTLTKRKSVVVCLGDSLTHGSISSNWVDKLTTRLSGTHTILNAGVNSETVPAVRARLTEVIATQPQAVCILIGTNDLMESLDTNAAFMYKLKLGWKVSQLQQEQTNNNHEEISSSSFFETYEKNLGLLIHELDDKLPPQTRIAILSPPPLGEGGMDGIAWRKGSVMADICQDVCTNFVSHKSTIPNNKERLVDYIPLYSKIKQDMMQVLDQPQKQQSISRQGPNSKTKVAMQEFDFGNVIPLTSFVVPWKTLIFGQSLTDIRISNRYRYTVDNVHFDDNFGEIVENLICNWILDGEEQQ